MFGVRDDAILLKLHGDSGLGFEAWSLGFGVSDYYSILLKLHEGSGFWLRVAGCGFRFAVSSLGLLKLDKGLHFDTRNNPRHQI